MTTQYNYLTSFKKEDICELNDDDLVQHYTDIISMMGVFMQDFEKINANKNTYIHHLEEFDHLNLDDKKTKIVTITKLNNTTCQMTIAQCGDAVDKLISLMGKRVMKFEKLNQIKDLILLEFEARGLDPMNIEEEIDM